MKAIEFTEKCKELSNALSGLGQPHIFRQMGDIAAYTPYGMGRGTPIFVYNSKDLGPIIADKVNINVTIKEFNIFLETDDD